MAKQPFKTNNYALSAVLGTLGFGWLHPSRPCENRYLNGNRPERKGNGKLGRLGRVTFHILRTSDEYPALDLDDVLEVFDGKTSPGEDIDRKLANSSYDHQDTRDLKVSLRELLPLAYAECSRNTLANLKARKDAPHKVAALIEIKKEDGTPIVVSENISPAVAERWGVEL